VTLFNPTKKGNARADRSSWGVRLLKTWSGLVYGFLYAPILILVVFSFNDSKRNAVWRGFTFKWYGELLHSSEILMALGKSLEVAIIATTLATILGTLAALGLSRGTFRGKAIYSGLIFLPIVIPEIIMGVSLLSLFVAMKFTLGLPTVILAHAAFSTSFVAVVVRARLQGYDPTLNEAAADLGATPWQTFREVTLPLILPGILSGALLAFTLSFDDFVITFFNSGAGATTLPIKVYSMIKFGVTPVINGVSTIMLSVTFTLTVLADVLQKKA
jgi:spermidine/putrescine transport system permease protein